ncbi:translation initiation factor IF-2-like [Lontra canadensis]|uniref:translation initiation factor IF-2-like n=1 Tax=Lontra canadensis TaxID=76717 RepID=UPI0013F2B8CE|nr:translation initiation factor IF-2-like [Lontra canadensis]
MKMQRTTVIHQDYSHYIRKCSRSPGARENLPPTLAREFDSVSNPGSEARVPPHTRGGARQGRDSTRRGSPTIPWAPNPDTPGPERPRSRPEANFSRSPKARRSGAIDVPQAEWARSPGWGRSLRSPPRSGGPGEGPQLPHALPQPAFSPRKPGWASGAGNSAPAKGEVEVELGARSVPAAAGATVPLPPSLPLSSLPACPRGPAPVTHLGAGAGWSGRARRRALPHVAPPMASWRARCKYQWPCFHQGIPDPGASPFSAGLLSMRLPSRNRALRRMSDKARPEAAEG